MTRRLLKTTKDKIFIIDDLSVGTHPSRWIENFTSRTLNDAEIIGQDDRLYFWKGDFRDFLFKFRKNSRFVQDTYDLDFEVFSDVFHLAAIVGGRLNIEGDPLAVALDLSIDAEFFYWVCRHKPRRVLYPSSSAAYPTNMQSEKFAVALKERDIDFDNMGMPDMTYGWSKLTGEFLAQMAAQYYGVSVVCVRPFSGYGEDQDPSYPVPAIALRAARRESPFEVWGSGKQGRDFVHIDDILDLIFVLMDNIKNGSAWNIGSGKLTSFDELIALFCDIAGYETELKPLLDKPVGVHSRYANMDLIQERFGWQPKISLREGMTRVYNAALEKLTVNKL